MRIETVTRVISYNTFRTKSRKHSVRLANLTENLGVRAQKRATKYLRRLISGKKVVITTENWDIYGRPRATVTVFINGKSVNLLMSKFLK